MTSMAQTRKISVEPKAERQTSSWHKSMKTVILIANCLGLLPVSGVTSDSVHNMNFRWISLKVFYSCIWLAIAVVNVTVYSMILFESSFSFTALGMIEIM